MAPMPCRASLRSLLAACALVSPLAAAQDLAINELMARTEAAILDEDGDGSDWIELFNAGPDSVDLDGWGLSDDPAEPLQWLLPAVTIAAGQPLRVFASGKDRTGSQLHTNFKLGTSGETVTLVQPDGTPQDVVTYGDLSADVSWGREFDGAESFVMFIGSTPGSANEDGLVASVEVSFSEPAGWYESDLSLTLSADSGFDIRYTLDGSEPTVDSPLYTGPLLLGDRIGDPNTISTINPTVLTSWQPPRTESKKVNIVKARAFDEEGPVSTTRFNTYIVDPEGPSRYQGMAIASLALDPDDLIGDERGIYVPGAGYDGDLRNANFSQRGRNWERLASMQFFDRDSTLQIDQHVGVRINGNYTRRGRQKSLRLYARSDYGAETFDYRAFDARNFVDYRRFILRRSSGRHLYREPFLHELIRDEVGFGVMESVPTVVFLNGEYWGVHHLRDRFDDYYIEYQFGVDRSNIDYWDGNPAVPGNVDEGTNDAYLALESFLLDPQTDLADDAAFAQFADAVDVPHFIDYIVAEDFLANRDWPHTNYDLWRDRDGGKIQFLFKDLDLALTSSQYEGLVRLVYPQRYFPSATWSTPAFLFSKAIKNEQFVADFLARYQYHVDNTFHPSRVFPRIDARADMMAPLAEEHADRFNLAYSPADFENVARGFVKRFFGARPCFVQYQLLEQFGQTIDLSNCTTPVVEVVFGDNGFGTVSNGDGGLDCTGDCTAPLDANGAVVVTATASPGSAFDGWEGCDEVSGPICTISLGVNTRSVTANFVRTEPLLDVIVDDEDANVEANGTWLWSSGAGPYAGGSVYSAAPSDTFRWLPTIEEAGRYEVYAWWSHRPTRSSNVPYSITHDGGVDEVFVDQRDAALSGQWNLLGSYDFSAGTSGFIEVSARNGSTAADAVRFNKMGQVPTNERLLSVSPVGSGAVTTASGAIDCPASCTEAYDHGTRVRLFAQAELGWLFDGWTGECEGLPLANDCVVTMVSNRTVTASFVPLPAEADIIVDDADANASSAGTWLPSAGLDPYGAGSLYGIGGGDRYRWTPTVVREGRYHVYAWWTPRGGRSRRVPFTINHRFGSDRIVVDQKDESLRAQWNLLGSFDFAEGSEGFVEVSAEGGQTSADAVRLIRTGDTGIVIDDAGPGASANGDWRPSAGEMPFAGGSLYSVDAEDSFRWTPDIDETGTYQVHAWWTAGGGRAARVPYRITHQSGTADIVVNQRDESLGGQWNLLGTYPFEAGTAGRIEVFASDGQTAADAVRLVRTDDTGIIIDDEASEGVSSTGEWLPSSGAGPYGGRSLYGTVASDTYRWTPTIDETGTYAVYVWWTHRPGRSRTAPYEVVHTNGVDVRLADQRDADQAGQWNLLGVFEFVTGTSGYVELSGRNGQVAADAARFVKVE